MTHNFANIIENKTIQEFYKKKYFISDELLNALIENSKILLLGTTGAENISKAMAYIFDYVYKHFYRPVKQFDYYDTIRNIEKYFHDYFEQYNENYNFEIIRFSRWDNSPIYLSKRVSDIIKKLDGELFTHKDFYMKKCDYIMWILYLKNFNEIFKYCTHNYFLFKVNDEKFKDIISMNDLLLKKNTIQKIEFDLFREKTNPKVFSIDVKELLHKNSISDYEKEIFTIITGEYKCLFNLNHGYINQEESIIILEEIYEGQLKENIEEALKELNDIEETRLMFGIKIKSLWKNIFKVYNIKLPDRIYNQNGELLDSQEELTIDDFFYYLELAKKLHYRRGYTFSEKFYSPNGYKFIPDWIINDNIIVEYFGLLERDDLINYKLTSLAKMRYFYSLTDYHFVPLFREDFKNKDLILHKLRPYIPEL